MLLERQVTPETLQPRISRLKPCPRELQKIIDFINEVPPDFEMKDLKLFPHLGDQFLRFLKKTSGTEDYGDISYRADSGPKSMTEWVDRLLELHRLMTWALAELSEPTRVHLWQEALVPQKMSDGSYGPSGKLAAKEVKRQTRLAGKLARRFAKDPLEKSISFLSQFLGNDSGHARFYFWAFYGLAKKYFLLREYRMNLEKVMKIAELNPTDRLSFSPVLYHIVISQEYSVDEGGKFIQLGNAFTDALEDEQVDVARIRTCSNSRCKKVFWAGRKDQTCCTPACNHIRHSKRTQRNMLRAITKGVNRIRCNDPASLVP